MLHFLPPCFFSKLTTRGTGHFPGRLARCRRGIRLGELPVQGEVRIAVETIQVNPLLARALGTSAQLPGSQVGQLASPKPQPPALKSRAEIAPLRAEDQALPTIAFDQVGFQAVGRQGGELGKPGSLASRLALQQLDLAVRRQMVIEDQIAALKAQPQANSLAAAQRARQASPQFGQTPANEGALPGGILGSIGAHGGK